MLGEYLINYEVFNHWIICNHIKCWENNAFYENDINDILSEKQITE